MIRKLKVLISAQHALMLAYRAEIYLWVIANILPFIMMSIWMTAAQTSASGGGAAGTFSMSPIEYARYFLAVFCVRQFSIVWMIYEFEWHVVEGRLTYLLLRPLNPIWQFVSSHLGEQMARFPFFVVIVIVFFCIYPAAFWFPAPWAILLGIVTTYCAFALRFSIAYCLSMLTFKFERASALENLSMIPFLFLSGMIIPIRDFPPEAQTIIRLTPFPYMIDFPVSILTGKILLTDPLLYQSFAMMALWFVALSSLGAFMWKRGLHHYSGHGA